MLSNPELLHINANRVTARFALFFSLDDADRHSDPASFLSHITDLGLIVAALEILPIVGHHLVDRATDFVLDKSIAAAAALKDRLLSMLRLEKTGQKPDASQTAELSTDWAAIVELMTNALGRSDGVEMKRALAAGQAAVELLTRSEFNFREAKAREYSIGITQEIKIAITGK